MRILFFPMHGQAAWEVAELCRNSGVACDVAGSQSRIVHSCIGNSQREILAQRKLGIPGDKKIVATLEQRGYDAVILTTVDQIFQFYHNVRSIDGDVPLVVRHGNGELAHFRRFSVENFMSPSGQALKRLRPVNPFLSRKLLAWDRLPRPNLKPSQRNGFSTYIHDYSRCWPKAHARYLVVNQFLKETKIRCFGRGTANGTVNDLLQMQRSRATVHIKDGNVCCNAVIRSMAMATPVVMDTISYSRCHFDRIEGLIVRETPRELARALERLAEDDQYWQHVAEVTLDAAMRQSTFDTSLGTRFRSFLRRSANTSRSGWDSGTND